MEIVQLTATAKEICAKNYNTNCGNCPLRPSCCRKVESGTEKINNWVNEINQLAEKLKGA